MALVFRFLFGSLLLSMMLLVLSVTTTIRVFPRLLNIIHRILRGFLILSYRLYHILLTILQPVVYGWFGVEILQGTFRWMFCLLFSLIIGLIPIILLDPSWVLWVLIFWILHGLFVGLAWDDIENPEGIQLGNQMP